MNDTPSTARTVPLSRLKYVFRSSTTRSGAAGSASFGRGRLRRSRAVVTWAAAAASSGSSAGPTSSSASGSGVTGTSLIGVPGVAG